MNLRFGLPTGFEARGLVVRLRTGAAFWMWVASRMSTLEGRDGLFLLEQGIESIERLYEAGHAGESGQVWHAGQSGKTGQGGLVGASGLYGLGGANGRDGQSGLVGLLRQTGQLGQSGRHGQGTLVAPDSLDREESVAVAERLFWFMRGGRELDERREQGSGNASENRGSRGGRHERLLDYEKDLDAIYAAFLQSYGIDLYAEHDGVPLVENMHWWRFLALVNNLPAGSTLVDYYMHYRGLDVRKLPRKSGAEKERLRRVIDIKRRVALDGPRERKKTEPAYARRAREIKEARCGGAAQ